MVTDSPSNCWSLTATAAVSLVCSSVVVVGAALPRATPAQTASASIAATTTALVVFVVFVVFLMYISPSRSLSLAVETARQALRDARRRGVSGTRLGDYHDTENCLTEADVVRYQDHRVTPSRLGARAT
jgi:uncharacterized protein YybS (DUF2232 family)